MSYSIIRVEKIKSSVNTTGIQKHVQRENNNYGNEDIQQELTQENYDLVNDRKQNFNDLIDEKIERNYTGKRKIRKDAVKHIDGMITS
ncbi:plasmid recombination protein, partial [Staphylococcus aureus]|uniref:plasmid recombination protein n=1 Tax=Staphylococcus aureus TaxID=1280 RepID=UPI0021B0E6EF